MKNVKKIKKSAANEKEAIRHLQDAYKKGKLILYLGAGASVASGLPSWEKLVLAMYFSSLKNRPLDKQLTPYPNYLFAISEWHLGRRGEPLDITARKVRNLYKTEQEFLHDLRHTLYAGFKYPGDQIIQQPEIKKLLETNVTLKSIVELCKGTRYRKLASVVTYNYDDLLEFALMNIEKPYQSIFNGTQKPEEGKLQIYHVHGFIPMREDSIASEEIIFTEEQYYLAAQNSYSWNNLVQIQCMSSSVGLMIGMSLKDRNTRRLLDAVQRTPILSENYVLLRKPSWKQPKKEELKQIDEKAKEYFHRFEMSGIKTADRKFEEITDIIGAVENRDLTEEETILKSLGVQPIWFDDHSEIEGFISRIISTG
jgi:hypothetical protein